VNGQKGFVFVAPALLPVMKERLVFVAPVLLPVISTMVALAECGVLSARIAENKKATLADGSISKTQFFKTRFQKYLWTAAALGCETSTYVKKGASWRITKLKGP
jgi:hypothetical protein